MTLADVLQASGYHVYHVGSTSAEIGGKGDWRRLTRGIKHLLRTHTLSHYRDHMTIVYRFSDGSRVCHDIGYAGEKVNILDNYVKRSSGTKTSRFIGVRRYERKGKAPRFEVTVYVGNLGKRKAVCLGMYDDETEAAYVHDRYCCEHGLKSKLNFPALMELKTA